MEISRILDEFDDLFMIYDVEEDTVSEIYPPNKLILLPCNILDIFRIKNIDLDIHTLKQIERFLKSSENCINIHGAQGWYSLELRIMEDGCRYLHLYNLDNSMSKMKRFLSQSQLDPLTNVLQRNAMESYVESVLSENPEAQASMFMLDVDYFKNINDNYGHLFGDKVIMAVAEALKGLSGESGKVGRIGGDEFILFVKHELDRMGLKNIARLIRYVLDNLKIDGKPFSCSATIGIAQYPKDGRSFQELYTACDKALYRGKEKGRDCHIIYDPLVHSGTVFTPKQENTATVNSLSITGFIGLILNRCLESVAENRRKIYLDIANFFNLDRIVLYRNGKAYAKYVRSEKDTDVSAYDRFVLEDYKKNFITDDMYHINDATTWKNKDNAVYNIYEQCNTISAVQILVFDQNDICDGFMSYETISSRRVWQRGELNAFALITKIINIFSNHDNS